MAKSASILLILVLSVQATLLDRMKMICWINDWIAFDNYTTIETITGDRVNSCEMTTRFTTTINNLTILEVKRGPSFIFTEDRTGSTNYCTPIHDGHMICWCDVSAKCNGLFLDNHTTDFPFPYFHQLLLTPSPPPPTSSITANSIIIFSSVFVSLILFVVISIYLCRKYLINRLNRAIPIPMSSSFNIATNQVHLLLHERSVNGVDSNRLRQNLLGSKTGDFNAPECPIRVAETSDSSEMQSPVLFAQPQPSDNLLSRASELNYLLNRNSSYVETFECVCLGHDHKCHA